MSHAEHSNTDNPHHDPVTAAPKEHLPPPPPPPHSLPTPPNTDTPAAATTMEQQQQNGHSALEPAPAPPPASLDSPAVPPPPPPAVPLPPHLGLPAKLEHTDSTSSVAAQPPTPMHQPAQPAQPIENGSLSFEAMANGAPHEHEHSHGTFNEQAEEAVEHAHAHPGLGSIQHEWEQRLAGASGSGADGTETPPAGVDVLADVAMGEAVLGLAEFAAGAGSGDVKEGSPGVSVQAADDGPANPVPPTQGGTLKRSSPDRDRDEAGDAAGLLGFAQGEVVQGGGDEREAKRVKVEPEVCPRFRSSCFRSQRELTLGLV